MTQAVRKHPVTIERLERALVLLAYFMELDGDVHWRCMKNSRQNSQS
jgi:hypothetical protein